MPQNSFESTIRLTINTEAAVSNIRLLSTELTNYRTLASRIQPLNLVVTTGNAVTRLSGLNTQLERYVLLLQGNLPNSAVSNVEQQATRRRNRSLEQTALAANSVSRSYDNIGSSVRRASTALTRFTNLVRVSVPYSSSFNNIPLGPPVGGQVPLDRSLAPQGLRIPIDRSLVPFDAGRVPVDRSSVPLLGGRVPFNRSLEPYGGGQVPFNRSLVPIRGGQVPFNRSLVPTRGGGLDTLNLSGLPRPGRLNRLRNSFSTFGNALGSLRQNLLGLTQNISIFTSILSAGLASALLNSIVQVEELTAGLRAFSDSEQEAEQRLQGLFEISNATGTSFRVLARTYRLFIPAVERVTDTVEQQQAVFGGLAVAASVYRLEQREILGTIRAFVDVASKGVLTSEELTRQFANQLPDAIGLFSRALETTPDDLFERVRAREITAEDIIPRVALQFIEELGPRLEFVTQTVGSSLNRLRNSFSLLAINLNESGVGAALTLIITSLNTLVVLFNSLPNVVQANIVIWGTLSLILFGLAAAFTLVLANTLTSIIHFRRLSVVLGRFFRSISVGIVVRLGTALRLLGPILALVFTPVGLLISTIVLLITNVDSVRDALDRFGGTVFDTIANLLEFIISLDTSTESLNQFRENVDLAFSLTGTSIDVVIGIIDRFDGTIARSSSALLDYISLLRDLGGIFGSLVSGDFAGALRNIRGLFESFGERLRDLLESLPGVTQPVTLSLETALTQAAGPSPESIFGQLTPTGIGQELTDPLESSTSRTLESLGRIRSILVEQVTSLFPDLGEAARGLLEQYTNQLDALIASRNVIEETSGLLRFITTIQENLVERATSFTDIFTDAVSSLGDSIADAFIEGEFGARRFFQEITRQLIQLSTNRLFSSLFGSFASALTGGVTAGVSSPASNTLAPSSIFSSLGPVTPFANGGSINEPAFGVTASGRPFTIAENEREFIIPESRLGRSSGGATVTQNISFNMSGNGRGTGLSEQERITLQRQLATLAKQAALDLQREQNAVSDREFRL